MTKLKKNVAKTGGVWVERKREETRKGEEPTKGIGREEDNIRRRKTGWEGNKEEEKQKETERQRQIDFGFCT